MLDISNYINLFGECLIFAIILSLLNSDNLQRFYFIDLLKQINAYYNTLKPDFLENMNQPNEPNIYIRDNEKLDESFQLLNVFDKNMLSDNQIQTLYNKIT